MSGVTRLSRIPHCRRPLCSASLSGGRPQTKKIGLEDTLLSYRSFSGETKRAIDSSGSLKARIIGLKNDHGAGKLNACIVLDDLATDLS